MLVSDLKQRIFDDLFHGLACLSMLSDGEIEEVAESLEDPERLDRENEPMFKAVAIAIRMAKGD